MAIKSDGRSQAGERQGTFAGALDFGGLEQAQGNPIPPQGQDEARQCEGMSRRYALAALCLGGSLALQHAALGSHYARRSMALMRGVGQ